MGTIHGAVQKLFLSDIGHDAMGALGQQHWCRGSPGTSCFFHQRFPTPRAWREWRMLRAPPLLPEGCQSCSSGCLPQAGAAAFGKLRPHSHVCQELPELLPNFPLAPGWGWMLGLWCSQLGSGSQVPFLAQAQWDGFCSLQPLAHKY